MQLFKLLPDEFGQRECHRILGIHCGFYHELLILWVLF
jgi:hypothetical protein